MANAALKTVNTRNPATPQTEKAVKGQKKNSAGGYVFRIGDIERAKRFLILGSDSSFYTPGQKLSKQNADNLIRLAESEHSRELVDLIVAISTAGRAPKQDPALFALAIASSHGSLEDKIYARSQLTKVARTATALFLYVSYAKQFRGWGRGMRNAVSNWYLSKDLDKLAYQEVKYQSREGYTHRDVLRLAHPKSADEGFNGLAKWALSGNTDNVPKIVKGYLKAKVPGADIPKLIRKYGLSWEMLPTEALNDKFVWVALLEGNLPLGALIRQLPRLSRIGIIEPFSEHIPKIVARLTDPQELQRARIHPINLLVALETYQSGHSTKGDSAWKPDPNIANALDKAFYAAFQFVEPAGKRTMLAIDLSASMTWKENYVLNAIDSRTAAAALALVTEATEPRTHIVGFTGGYRAYGAGITPLNITSGMRLDQVVAEIGSHPAGGTDCALPMVYAEQNNLKVDTFVVYTDNETHSGPKHVFEALESYRRSSGIDAKLVVVGMTATPFSIANPNDDGMLDVAGFDTAVPALISQFSADA